MATERRDPDAEAGARGGEPDPAGRTGQASEEGTEAAAGPGRGRATAKLPEPLPFPTSLCHRCAAPPRYITSGRGSVFILCPLLPAKYPPQPVRTCTLFRPR